MCFWIMPIASVLSHTVVSCTASQIWLQVANLSEVLKMLDAATDVV
jgi:hypothetical protein